MESEKSIAAIAIRLALLTVSSLPKADIFILDGPGTELDEENMENFIQILDLIKSYFKTVILISHLDSLKDCVDQQIKKRKKRGFLFENKKKNIKQKRRGFFWVHLCGGVVVGAVASPFAWVALKWCYGQVQDRLGLVEEL